jgi:hypothetical protein
MSKSNENPSGCLGCNKEEVTEVMLRNGFDPESFVEVPTSKHRWGDVVNCNDCGRFWLLPQRGEN